MFAQTRLALAFKRWADTEQINLAGADPVRVSTTAHQALAWTTVNAAEALGLQDRIGSITIGKRADLIVVGGASFAQHPHIDATGTLVFQTAANDVRMVLVDGRVVKRDGALVDVDLAGLTTRADESARAIFDRVRAKVPHLPGTPATGFDGLAELVASNLQALP